MRWLLLVMVALGAPGCLKAWEVGGPYACGENAVCPGGLTCDDGLCCDPKTFSPACPTLPLDGKTCPGGGEPKDYFQDLDDDGDGNEKVGRRLCRAPIKGGWVLSGRDCDDTRKDIFFGAPELCNGKDDNCDGQIDEGLPNPMAFFRDEDGDGQGAADAGLMACMAPPGFSALAGDCQPLDPTRFSGAAEQCNNIDDDCDGQPDRPGMGFVDTDNTPDGGSNGSFPCLVPGAQGVCQAGAFRCVAASGGGVRRACVGLTAASREVCDGLDNNCNGVVDEMPLCGGPRTLIGAPGVTYKAQRLTTTAQLNSRCQTNVAGVAESVSANGSVWTINNAGFHVWSAEAPAGTFWDLSRLDAELRLAFTAAPGADWSDPAAGGSYNPVVYLCGVNDTEIIRYRIASPGFAFKTSDTRFDRVLPLNNSSSTWLVGTGSGFDTSRVRRIEVLVFASTAPASLNITFDATIGMGP